MEFIEKAGSINFIVTGQNAFIKRKNGTKVNMPSVEIRTKLLTEFQKTKDNSKLLKFEKDYPKLMDGDTLISGKGTTIQLDVNYKNKLYKDYRSNASKSIFAGPNSEFKVSGGQTFKNIELIKGFFNVNYSHCEEGITTPVAEIKFNLSGGAFIDVYNDKIYSLPIKSTSIGAKGIDYKNKLTKKVFSAKSDTYEEIIVTKDSIYRKGLTNLDEIFQNPMGLLMVKQKAITATIPDIDPADFSENLKNVGNNFEQAFASLEMFKNMSPDDIERLVKTADPKMTPEQKKQMTPEMIKQMRNLPDMLKKMEKIGDLEQMKKATATLKGMSAGYGEKGIENMSKATTKGMKKLKETDLTKTESGKDYNKLIEQPRKYNPLTKDFGCVKVG